MRAPETMVLHVCSQASLTSGVNLSPKPSLRVNMSASPCQRRAQTVMHGAFTTATSKQESITLASINSYLRTLRARLEFQYDTVNVLPLLQSAQIRRHSWHVCTGCREHTRSVSPLYVHVPNLAHPMKFRNQGESPSGLQFRPFA